jgi:hypothetical protein
MGLSTWMTNASNERTVAGGSQMQYPGCSHLKAIGLKRVPAEHLPGLFFRLNSGFRMSYWQASMPVLLNHIVLFIYDGTI